MNNKLSIGIISIVFVWSGMLMGISFLEAPLKFQAPGITLELGLGIGKLVFGALTRIELAFSFILMSLLLFNKASIKTWLLFVFPIIIVLIDNLVLLPILDSRIDIIVSGITPPKSNTHWWYVALELIKLVFLILGGVKYTSLKMD